MYELIKPTLQESLDIATFSQSPTSSVCFHYQTNDGSASTLVASFLSAPKKTTEKEKSLQSLPPYNEIWRKTKYSLASKTKRQSTLDKLSYSCFLPILLTRLLQHDIMNIVFSAWYFSLFPSMPTSHLFLHLCFCLSPVLVRLLPTTLG